MKKLITLILLTLSASAMAQHYHGHGFRHPGHYRGPGIGWWVAPVVTGVIGYEIAKQQQVIVQQPVVVQSLPAQPSQNCTPWTETQHPDGTITRTRTCAQ
jgi:hypothetical protein